MSELHRVAEEWRSVRSTKPSRTTCAYLGIDVTDRFSNAARPMDVCGLEMRGSDIIAYFWTWNWEAG